MKILYYCLSIFFLVLAFIGIVIPGLPATPFIFLSVFFAMRSSEKLANYIKGLNIYKKHLEPFAKDRVMSNGTKVRILLIATSMIMIPIIIVPNTYLRVFLVCLIIAKYIFFIFFIKTSRDSNLSTE